MISQAFQWLSGVPTSDLSEADERVLRFTGVPENLWLLMGLLVLFGLLAWFVTRVYRREGRGSRLVRGVLTALRTATLLLLLAIILQPALVLRYHKPLPSSVALLVDDSLSMRWADRYGQKEDVEALAKFLHVPAEKLEGPERLTRLDAVRRALTESSDCLARLGKDHTLFLVNFGATEGAYTKMLASCGEEGRRKGAALPAGKCPPEIAAGLGQLSASGVETNVGRALRETLEMLAGRRLAGVVLVSDGQDTGAGGSRERLSAAAALLRERGVPLYAVAVGDPTPPKNIMLAQLQGPGEVRKGSTIQLTAFVLAHQYAGVEVPVKLLRAKAGTANWEDTHVVVPVKLGVQQDEESAGKVQEVALTTTAPEVGEFTFKAVIDPLPDEMNTSDNEATATVKVSDQQLHILLVSGAAGWEFQFLRNYILRQPEHYKMTVLQQNADPSFNQDASTGMKRSTLPKTREDLFAYDLVILYDPSYEGCGLDAEFLGLLEDFVSKHHGGLCYIAGDKYTSNNLAEGGPLGPLAKLLPVIIKKERPAFAGEMARSYRNAWAVQVPPQGLEHPVMKLAESREENQRVWRLLPGIYHSQPVVRLKALATALAFSTDPERQTLDGVADPLLAVQYYGKGRVLYFGFDSTWRWRNLADAKHYQRFWANALDFLSAGRLEKKRLLVTTGGDAFDLGTSIRVRVEAYTRGFTPLDGKTFTVALTNLDTKETMDDVLHMTSPGFFEGSILANHTGSFRFTPKADATGQADWTEADVAAKPFKVRLSEDEFRKPEADYTALSELAGKPERFLRLQDLDSLPDKIPPDKSVHIQELPSPLWNTPLMLALLGLLLMGEWTVRKFYHMM